MIGKKYVFTLLLTILLLSGVTALVLNNIHTFTGRYVPLLFNMNPVTMELGDVNTDDIITYNITLGNPNQRNLTVKYIVESPAWIDASIIGWSSNTNRVLLTGENMTVTVKIRVGLPVNMNVTQLFEGTFQFIASKT